MEEYLRRVQQCRLGAPKDPVHAVLGGPRPDVDTVAATLSLALHLNQKEASGGLCVPVLCGRRGNDALPEATLTYLQRVNICESLLLWREDVDLVTLHHTGKLSLTLLRDGLLDSSEYHVLESSVLRVVHHDGQRDTGDDGASFAVTTVAREIRQEAAEHIRAALGKTLGEALRLHSEALRIHHGRHSTQLEELRRSLERPSDVIAAQSDEAKPQYLEQLLTTELREFSDGETTIALSSVTTDTELWPVNVAVLKSFCHHHNFNGLVLLLSSNDTVTYPGQQVAVYSSNTGLLKQICCDLESSCWSLSGELEPRENLQVYHIPMTTSSSSGTRPLLEEEIQTALKYFVDKQRSVLARHSSRRTSSTEGVAGSVEFSQGSSGINDMDGSDIERPEGGSANVVAIARVMAHGGEDAGTVGVNTDREVVSPDSGMTTIRSSRSSKESSVFLSDDSPVGEVTAGGGPAVATGASGLFLRNTSPLGVSSLSPPVPPERRKHRPGRNESDSLDLLGFDPLQSSDLSLTAGEDPSLSEGRGDGGIGSNMSELEELSFLTFSSESRNSSTDHHGQILGSETTDTVVPPTPVNSLVGSRPPSRSGLRFFPEDVVERINSLQHKDSVSSSLSETWDELCFDGQGGLTSSDNRTKENRSPKTIVENVGGKELITEGESWEETFRSENPHRRPKTLEPQLSLVAGQTESHNDWNPDSVLKDPWNTVTLSDLHLTPPEEEGSGKCRAGIIGVEEKTMSCRKKAVVNTLTPDTSKEEDDGVRGKKEDRKMELLDFWTYSAQKGFLKSDSGTTTSYPESLDMWNMTIRDDSLSPLTTPDNFSENSGSFCGMNPNLVDGASVESPPGFTDGGMVMWNTTIQEDTGSSTVTSPDNGKDLSHSGSLDAGDSPESCAVREPEDDKAFVAGSDLKNIISQTPKEVECGGKEHNVRIVIDAAEGKTQQEEMEEDDMQAVLQNLASDASERKTLPPEDANMWDLPVPGMVTSNSEYDNIGAGGWSHISSPETCASPVVDMIQLEEQSSPFVAVTNPIQINETPDVSKGGHSRRSTDSRTVISNKQKPDSQVFLFQGTSGSSIESEYDNKGHEGSTDVDWREQPSEHSPFVMVDSSSATQQISGSYHSSAGEAAETHIQTNQYLYLSQVSWDGSDVAHGDDGTATETQHEPNKENYGDGGSRITESMSLSSSAGGKRDILKCSPDSLHPGSRDEARSNSDGDSSSGLEMEYIVVSGTVKEAEREWHDRPKQGDRQTKGVKKAMETFSTLFYAASVLQSQVQGARREQQKETSTQNQMTADNQAALPSQHHINPDDSTESHVVPEMISPSQSQNVSKAFHQSHSSPKGGGQAQVDEGNYDDKSSTVTRSVSPSLRYPSDNFLKAREEVYVRSQISMEDSDEGGQSPSAPPPCPTSLGDFQDWGGQLVRQDIPQAPASEIQSPVLTNSSVSHPTSSAGTPLSETETDRGLGLPFSGDLMEEENDEEEEEDETGDMGHLTKWTPEVQANREDNQQLASCDLLSFTEELVGGSSLKHGRSAQDTGDYYDGQSIRTTDGDEWQQTGGHEASRDRCPSVSRRHDVATQPTDENAAYQWTGSHNVTQGQTQYGYNYHHIDQRTENHSMHSACMEAKPGMQQNTSAVYAEFTSDASHPQCGPEQSDSYYGAGPDAGYSPDVSKSQSQYGGDSSQRECSRYQAGDQCPYETVQYQTGGQPLYHSDNHPEREDHARYVPEGSVHFLHSRHSQQRDSAAGMMMMMKMASSEEAAEDPDNREADPASSADVSGSSNQRRKLAAPPMSVSLDHSEGSLLSEDALDTEDEALDTGDDLDINIDELDTPDEADSVELNRQGESEESNLGAGAASGHVTDGRGSADGSRDDRLWRSVVIGEQEHRIDMKSIDQYKRVISHGGYYAEHNAIIVFAACFLPDSDCDNYNYVMENLFLYVISTLELMVAEDYMIVYLNGATPRRRMPGFSWMKKCYQMIDRRLKKNLKMFIIVHPSWFIRTLLGITRPFISSKFSSKIKYVHSLRELGEIIPMEYVHIPPSIIKYDEERGRFACMRPNTDLQNAAVKAEKRGNSAV